MRPLASLAAPLSVAALLVGCSAHSAAPSAPTTASQNQGVSPVVAIVGGQSITLAELDKKAGQELYDLREHTLDQLIIERVVEKESKAVGKTSDEYLRTLVEAKVPEVSEKEASEFYAKNQDRLGDQFKGVKFDEVKPIIVKGLTSEKRKAALAGIFEDLKAKNGVKVMLEPPRVEVAATGPARGPAGAKVTIVEFSDFQCPFCARGRQVMDQVLKAYDGKVRLVFRDFPLSFHEHAVKAAEAGQCANEQGKFWPMHDWMFENQGALADGDLKEAAKKLGLDGVRFDQCMTTSKYAGAVADSMKAGEKAGVKGTPAFFVNGIFLSGALPFEKFKDEIDKALTR